MAIGFWSLEHSEVEFIQVGDHFPQRPNAKTKDLISNWQSTVGSAWNVFKL